jgi:hypothetical protein
MEQSLPPNSSQQIKIDGSRIHGHVGQAGGDLEQINFEESGSSRLQIILTKPGAEAQLKIEDCRNLLGQVKTIWKSQLEDLTQNLVTAPLKLEERLDLLEQSWGAIFETPEQLRQFLPPGTTILEWFEQLGEGGTLLVLGNQSLDKTKLLLELTNEFISRIEQILKQQETLAKMKFTRQLANIPSQMSNYLNTEAESVSIPSDQVFAPLMLEETQEQIAFAVDIPYSLPVIFHLSSWQGKNQTIADWLIRELREKYRISKKLSETLIEDQYLLVLVEGLNEVHQKERNLCIEALNQFVEDNGTTRVVICSHIEEYKTLSQYLTFQSAIDIQSKTH